MANLNSQANRLNDVEINNNKPVTAQVARRIGSNINYILDFLGVPNGSTTTAGSLGTVGTAKEVITWSVSPQVIPVGGSITLFTFTGDNERHLSWVLKSSGFGSSRFPFDPFLHILERFQSMIGIGGQPLADTVDLRVNGISVQTLRMPTAGGGGTYTQVRFPQCAPSGTNTVTAHNMRSFGLTLSGGTGPHTYEKIFI